MRFCLLTVDLNAYISGSLVQKVSPGPVNGNSPYLPLLRSSQFQSYFEGFDFWELSFEWAKSFKWANWVHSSTFSYPVFLNVYF